MADIPVQRSYQQILGSMIDAFRAEKGIKSLRAGGAVLCSLEAAARSDMRSNQDIFAMLSSIDLDKARGLALDRIGQSENIPRLFQKPATGRVTVTDSRYSKIQAKLAASQPAPIAGVVKVYVQDGSRFGTSGSIYIGRGTSNYEGPLLFTSCVNAGSFWEITLAFPTTKYHNLNEIVILAQGGNRTIAAGQVVSTTQAALADAAGFALVKGVKLPDGEVELDGVEVVCTEPGLVGNVGAKAITTFSNPPFSGAIVSNKLPFSNGRDTEDNDSYRERIRIVRKTRAKGTALALKSAVLGLTAEDSSAAIASSALVRRTLSTSTLYIDDGSGYEETDAGIALETLVDNAAGGEDVFELQHRPIAKASLVALNQAPYDISDAKTLVIAVGGVSYTHTFQDSDAVSAKSASAYEVAASINANPALGFVARTGAGGTLLVVSAKADRNEDIEVRGGSAVAVFGLPMVHLYSSQLYKNDKLLTKDGVQAKLWSKNFSQWGIISSPATLTLAIDGTPALLYSIQDQDFVDHTSFSGVGLNSLEAWAQVLNSVIPGITAEVDGSSLVLISNAGASSRASLGIVGGSLVSNNVFALGTAIGADNDYVLSRNTSSIELVKALEPGDQLSIGTPYTRAFSSSKVLEPTSYGALKLWLSVDGLEQVIAHGITPVTPVSFTLADEGLHSWGYEQKISCTGAFSNVQSGDWLTLWDPVLPTTYHGTFKVGKVDPSGDWVTIERTNYNLGRVGFQALALPNPAGWSKVLIMGGGLNTSSGFTPSHLPASNALVLSAVTRSCDIYDPVTGLLTRATSMMVPRAYFSAILLQDGRVFVAGGYMGNGSPTQITETYNPATGSWSPGPDLGIERAGIEAVLLNSGKVLLIGGYAAGGATDICELFDPATETIVPTGSLNTARSCHKAVLLGDGKVFVHGGRGIADIASCEIYDPATELWTSKTSAAVPRSMFGMAYETIGNKVLCFGNNFAADPASFEVYDVANDSWSVSANIADYCLTDNDLVSTNINRIVAARLYSLAGDHPTAHWASGDGWVPASKDYASYHETVRITGAKSVTLNLNNFLNKKVVVIGGYDADNKRPSSTIETYEPGVGWSFGVPETAAPVYLTACGISVVRTQALPTEVSVTPSPGVNYTATMLAPALASALTDASVRTWHTKTLRLSTNSFNGSVAVLGANAEAKKLGFEQEPKTSYASHLAYLQSGSELERTPSFNTYYVYGRTKPVSGVEALLLDGWYDLSYNLLLRSPPPLLKSIGVFPFSKTWYSRTGHQQKNLIVPKTATDDSYLGNLDRVELRSFIQRPLFPHDTAIGLAQFAIGPEDELDLELDNDGAKKHSLRCWRRIQSAGAQYSQSGEYLDFDGSSLALGFGLGYDFADFALYMKARSVLFPNDDRRAIARFYRLGPEGEGVRLIFDNPDTENSTAKYGRTVSLGGRPTHRFLLPSGARRTSPFAVSTRYRLDSGASGFVLYTGLDATSGTRDGAGDVTLTVTRPPGLASHSLQAGDVVYVSTDNVAFPAGLYLLNASDATHVTYNDGGAAIGDTAISGYVSVNIGGEVRLDSSGILTDDFCYIKDVAETYRVSQVNRRDIVLVPGYHTLPVVSGVIQSIDQIQFWANPKKSAAQVLTEISGQAPELSRICPVSLTLVGAGATTLYRSTLDEFGAGAWYTLADGMNWVESSAPPPNTNLNYSLALKKPITGSLAQDSDWQNEELRLVPVTLKTLLAWCNTPAVTGLSNDAVIEAASGKLQLSSKTAGSAGSVQVLGGTANALSLPLYGNALVKASACSGLRGGMWTVIENQYTAPKSVLSAGTSLTSITEGGYVTLGGTNVYTERVAAQDMLVTIEKVGRFVAVRTIGVDMPAFASILNETLWIDAPATAGPEAAVSAANRGHYKIMRYEGKGTLSHLQGTFWIEAPDMVEEFCYARVGVYARELSVEPGDRLHINTDLWGPGNRGTWTVESVGKTPFTVPYTVPSIFKLSTATRTPVPWSAPALGTQLPNVYVEQKLPEKIYARIESILPYPENPDYAQLDLDVSAADYGPQAGAVLSLCDKLGFDTVPALGRDGYRYNTGLIAEANKALYGDPADAEGNPGVVAAGVQINISAGYVRRIKVALAIRVQSGVSRNDIASRVRSAVASIVNQAGLGQSISIASMIKAAQTVPGVVSVAWMSPSYAASDLVNVQGYEKPMVLDLDTDVQVSFVGE